MNKYTVVELIKDKIELFNLKQAALSSISSIYYDYFFSDDYLYFEDNHLYNEAVVMKAAAYRFATPEVMTQLFKHAVKSSSFEADDYIIHPVFYLRISKPKVNSLLNSEAILDSQPHYDRSFGAFSYSFWLALEDATMESGGLCFFNDSVEPIFSVDWKTPNKYNYDKYLQTYTEIDSHIRDELIYPNVNAGSAYRFDSNALHAATKSRSRVRLSFDFRITEKNKIADLDQRTKKIFYAFNENIALSNAKNLKLLGDDIGVKRYVQKYSLISHELVDLSSMTNILIPQNKLSWRTEYAWIDKEL